MVSTKHSEMKDWCRACKFEGIEAFCDECEDGVYFRESSEDKDDDSTLTKNYKNLQHSYPAQE
jgi:hypothetical protein